VVGKLLIQSDIPFLAKSGFMGVIGAGGNGDSLAIYGTHGYQFGGKGGSASTDEQITEQELGTDTATSQVNTLSTPRRNGSNAQTATEIYTMGGATAVPTHIPQTDIEEYTVGSETQSAHKSDLEFAVTYVFNNGYNATYAFVMSGTTLSELKTEIQQYEMGTDSSVSSPADVQYGVWGNAGGTNSTFCYSYTGSKLPGASRSDYIQTYEMEVDTTASHTGDSDPARYNMGGSGQSTTHIVGYGGDSD